MENLILKGYEFLTVIISFLLAFSLICLKDKRKNKVYCILTFAFAIYIFGVFHFTGTGTLFNIKMYGIQLGKNQINIVPFSNEIDIIAYLLNIVLFIPFGFLIPLIWPKYNKVSEIIVSSGAFSLIIEVSQLLNNRRTDIDDLIMNILGAIIGYAIFCLFESVTSWSINQETYYKYEVALYVGVMFLGHFLLFNEFGLAKMLFNI